MVYSQSDFCVVILFDKKTKGECCYVKVGVCLNNESSYSMYLCFGGTGRQEVLVLSKPDEGAGSRWLQRLLLSPRLGRDEPPLFSRGGESTDRYSYFDKKRIYVKATQGSLLGLN